MIAVDGSIIGSLIGGGFLMLAGLLGVVFRLGRVDQTVSDLKDTVGEMKSDVDELLRRDRNERRTDYRRQAGR